MIWWVPLSPVWTIRRTEHPPPGRCAMAHIVEITDLSLRELSPYTQLTHAQLRSRREPEQGVLIAESAKVISCALDAGCRPLSLLMERRHLPLFARQLEARCG